MKRFIWHFAFHDSSVPGTRCRMRPGYVLLVALSALLVVSRECDAATKVLKTQNLIDDDNDRRLLRSRDTTGVEDEERSVSLKNLLGLMKLKKAPTNLEKVPANLEKAPAKLEKVPIDLSQTPIVIKKIRADFSEKYVQAMLENNTFKTKMFKKWDVYTDDEILRKMKRFVQKRSPALVLEYMNRRTRGVAAGNIVTGKANINVPA